MTAAARLTCSPVKSVSAAWALARLPIARAIEDCRAAAVADVLRRQLEMVSAQACSRAAGAGSQALGVDTAWRCR